MLLLWVYFKILEHWHSVPMWTYYPSGSLGSSVLPHKARSPQADGLCNPEACLWDKRHKSSGSSRDACSEKSLAGGGWCHPVLSSAVRSVLGTHTQYCLSSGQAMATAVALRAPEAGTCTEQAQASDEASWQEPESLCSALHNTSCVCFLSLSNGRVSE